MRMQFRKIWPAALLLLISTSSWAVEHQVAVGGTYTGDYGTDPILMFNPSTLTINVGDTVKFTNISGPHNVHAVDESFRCANGCDGQGGNGNPSGDPWTSTVAFNQAGTFAYRCDNHGAAGMTGVITVQGGGGSTNLPITAAFTGTWYDPTQSGHGIFLEILPNNQILAWWFAFNPDGTQQSWFGNVGSYSGDTATVDALQTSGGRWIPNFNPANVTQPAWGRLTFTFSDCNHGRVEFDSPVPGYGTGGMDLTRLTLPLGLTCP